MSVLSCSVKGCINIMCDCCIPGIGYICIDCQDRFIEQVKHNTIGNEKDIIAELKLFVSSSSYRPSVDNSEMLLNFFKRYENQ